MTARNNGYINGKDNGSEEGDMNNGNGNGNGKTRSDMAKIKTGDFNGVKKIAHTRAKQANQAQEARSQRMDGTADGVAYGAPRAIDKNYSWFVIAQGEGDYAQDIDVVVPAGSLPEGIVKESKVSAKGVYYPRYSLLANGKIAIRPTILATVECAVVDELSNGGKESFELGVEGIAIGMGRKFAFAKNENGEADRSAPVYAQVVFLSRGRVVARGETPEGRSDTLRETTRVVVISGAGETETSDATRNLAFTKKGHRAEIRGPASVDVNTGGVL